MTPEALNLPLVLKDLDPAEVNWLAAKSAQEHKSTGEIVHDLLKHAAEKAGFKPQPAPAK